MNWVSASLVNQKREQKREIQVLRVCSEKRRLKIFDLSAETYDSRENFFEWLTRIKSQRKKLFSKARGRVLEIGAGTGRNLEVLKSAPGVTSLTCVDTSGPMCEVLASKIGAFSSTEIEMSRNVSKGMHRA
ncbi:methyltransferase domain protein, partial [Toxoplasma gondii MAS]